MHVRLREEFETDLERSVTITDYATEKNRFEIDCRSCRKTLFADETALSEYNHAMEQGFDSPFVCDDCLREESETMDDR